jgi:DNA-binding NtrC family response regulator
MKKKKHAVLIVEDEDEVAASLAECVKVMGYRAASCRTEKEVMPAIVRYRPSVILLDIKLPDADGIDVLKRIKKDYEDIPVIMITGYGSVDKAAQCKEYEAYDFFKKPPDHDRLEFVLAHAVKFYQLQQQVRRFESPEKCSFDEMIGICEPMKAVYRVITNVAGTDATVLITGESGTGKELVARSIHKRGKRDRGPFMAVNCAAIPRELLESELFGHEKGAFTGAIGRHLGCCEAANGGTLFLDEICEMRLDLQAKLLRFLQDYTFQRVGGTETITADVRVIAATNKDPVQEVERRNLREDLYYRLMVVPIDLPPLRERDGDLRILARYFLQEFSEKNKKLFTGFTQKAMAAMQSYSWRGNVRELENVIEGVVALHEGPTVRFDYLPTNIRETYQPSGVSFDEQKVLSLSEVVKQAVGEALQATNGDVTLAAEKLKLPEKAVREKAEEIESKGGW